VSEILPPDLHAWVAGQLEQATTRDEVRAVFVQAREREQLVMVTPAASAPAIPTTERLDQITRETAAGMAILEMRDLRTKLLAEVGLS
jgi:hypothetical protein